DRRLPASSEKEDFPDKSARPALKERSPARHCRISSSTDSSRVNGTYVKQYPTRSCAETEFSEALAPATLLKSVIERTGRVYVEELLVDHLIRKEGMEEARLSGPTASAA